MKIFATVVIAAIFIVSTQTGCKDDKAKAKKPVTTAQKALHAKIKEALVDEKKADELYSKLANMDLEKLKKEVPKVTKENPNLYAALLGMTQVDATNEAKKDQVTAQITALHTLLQQTKEPEAAA